MGESLVEIRDTALSVDEVIAAVSGPGVGGTAIFLGTVRDNDHGKSVAALDYSAHPTALSEMRRVVAEVAAQAPGVRLAAVHRVGPLRIGDVAVIVAAGAPHRDAAFVAGRTLIDRVKAEVPLWKHQGFSDGTGEWVGACDPPTA
jgi:molybdopterin synthase catalytic subunit